MLFRTDVSGYGIPVALVIGLSAATALFIFAVSGLALRARRRPVVSGPDAMLGSIGEMLEDVAGPDGGWARVHGEQWRVHGGEAPVLLARGERVRVIGRHGLTLTVAPLDETQGEKR
jgi:membrane-bound serine protease (ClpP class)